MNGTPAIAWPTALAFWLRLGFISFGGPAGQIALMHDELVVHRRWISEQRFLHALNFCMVLPGPEALQVAIYLGWLFHRRLGGIAAGLLFILPAFLLLMLLSWIYLVFGQVAWVAALFHGIQPAVIAIVIQACLRIGGRVLRNPALWAVAVGAFLALLLADLPFPLVIGLAAVVGAVGMRWRPGWFASGSGAHKASRAGPAATALFDDHSPPPPHAQPGGFTLFATLGSGLLLWLLPLLTLIERLGAGHALSRMAWFFSKAALLTFGGAYAVLPYVFQGAVNGEGWLTPAQMIDGLALGETTPGPLIIVVAFVGFVGAWQQAVSHASAPLLAGIAGASVACWFTFLPSFVMVLAGGPWIEATRRTLRFTGPLTAISAAVSGVIVHLALFFAWHVFWPHGWQGPVDLPAVAIALLALWMLLRLRRSVIEVIALCAALGGLAALLPKLPGVL